MKNLTDGHRRSLKIASSKTVSVIDDSGRPVQVSVSSLKNWTPCSGRSKRFGEESNTIIATRYGKSIVGVDNNGNPFSATPSDIDNLLEFLAAGKIPDQNGMTKRSSNTNNI